MTLGEKPLATKPSLPSENWKELVISDLHLTESVEDEYKWDIFPWVQETMKKYEIYDLYILGDLLDKKDRHPSKLVNRLVEALQKIVDENGAFIRILMGNHDYIAEATPFLDFISKIPRIEYTTKPSAVAGDLWLPHTRTPTETWKDFNFKIQKRIFIHQSIIGAKTSQFYNIEHGLPTTFFNDTNALILAGDIHIPQEINGVFYIGSPYPVHYGDNFQGCAVLLSGTKTKRLFRDTIAKQSVKIRSFQELKGFGFKEGDRLKVTMVLEAEEVHSWNSHKKEVEDFCKKNKIKLASITLKKQESSELEQDMKLQPAQKSHKELFDSFCKHLELETPTIDIGTAILKQAQR